MDRNVDFRAGRPDYYGPQDPNFVTDTLFWMMRTRTAGGYEYETIRDDLREAFGRKDAKSGLQVAAAAAQEWAGRARAGTLTFAHIYVVAKALDCAAKPAAPDADPEPETDPAKLRARINATLDAELAKVRAATEELRSNPSVLGLAAAGDARALKDHLEKLKAQAPPPAAPPTPAPAAPVPRPRRRIWPFKRDASPCEGIAAAAEQAGRAASAPRAAPSPLREELLELSSAGASPMMLAAEFGHAECVAALLEAAAADGPDTLRAMLSQEGREDYRGRTPFTIAAVKSGGGGVVVALAAAGMDLRAPLLDPFDRYGPRVSPLELLVREASEGSLDAGVATLKEVLALAAAQDPAFDVNAPVKRRTPRGRSRGRPSEDFAEADGQGDEGEEEVAGEEEAPGDDEGDDEGDGGHDEFRAIHRMMMINRILGFGGGDDEEEEEERTMLDVAAAAATAGARVDVIAALLAAGARPTAKTLVTAVRTLGNAHSGDYSDSHAMMDAAVAAGFAAFSALLDACDDVNAASGHSNTTALHEAAALGCLPAAKALLARKADTGARDEEGTTPMEVAEAHGDRAMVDLMARQHRLRRLLSGGGSSARRRTEVEAEALPDEDKCIICCSARKEVIAAPCGHKSTCKRCTRTVLTRPPGERNCPLCRERLESFVLTVYDV